MNYLRIAAGIAVVVIGVLAWGQHREIGLQQQLIDEQKGAISAIADSMETVLENSLRGRDQISELLSAQSKINGSLSARQTEIRRLQNDVAEIRTWADKPLPADIVRMRKRPTIKGASGYGEPVPSGGPLPAAGGGTAD